MKYLAALLFFLDITAATPEQIIEQWWPNEWGAPCTTKTDRKELGTSCTGLELRKPSWMKK